MSEMLEVLWQCRGAFITEGEKDKPIEYWLNMLESQLAEARMHLARGEIDRCRHEISDHILVAFHALDDTGEENPETYVAESIRRRVMPKVAHLMNVYGANGYKHGVKPIKEANPEKVCTCSERPTSWHLVTCGNQEKQER